MRKCIPIRCTRCRRVVGLVAEEQLATEQPRIAEAHSLVCSARLGRLPALHVATKVGLA